MGFFLEAGLANSIAFTSRADHCHFIGVLIVDPSIVFWVIVKIVGLYSDWSIVLTVLLIFEINNPPFQPTSWRMIRIDTIIYSDLFSWFPLRQYAVWPNINVLIKSTGPPWVMNIGLIPLDVDDLSIDPFIFGVPHINILSEVVLIFFLTFLHHSRAILL